MEDPTQGTSKADPVTSSALRNYSQRQFTTPKPGNYNGPWDTESSKEQSSSSESSSSSSSAPSSSSGRGRRIGSNFSDDPDAEPKPALARRRNVQYCNPTNERQCIPTLDTLGTQAETIRTQAVTMKQTSSAYHRMGHAPAEVMCLAVRGPDQPWKGTHVSEKDIRKFFYRTQCLSCVLASKMRRSTLSINQRRRVQSGKSANA